MRILLALFLTLVSVYAQKDVLLLHSYHKGYKWSDDISKAIGEQFSSRKDIYLTTEYMHTKFYDSAQYLKLLKTLYTQKYQNKHFDVIITSDDIAFNFALQNRETIFNNAPIVFCGINNFSDALVKKYNAQHHVTGIIEKTDILRNIKLIEKLQPDLTKLLIINDKSKTALAVKDSLFKALRDIQPAFEVEYVDDLNLQEIKTKVKSMPNTSAVLFLLLFKDTTGQNFTYKQSLEKITTVSHIPIYGLWDFYLGHGIVGGLLTNGYAQGKHAALKTLAILNGINVRAIPIERTSPNRFMFDYNALKKHQLKISHLPLGSLIINKPFSFYEQNKRLVWTVLFVFAIFVGIMAFLITNIIKRRKYEKKLFEQLEFTSTLIDTIKSPIMHKDLHGTYLGCNKAFSDLFNKPKEDIIGKNLYDITFKEYADVNTKKDLELIDSLGSEEYEMRLNLPYKRYKDVLINKSTYHNVDGKVGGIVCVMHDITDRKKIEFEKKQQEQFILQQSKLAEMGEMIAAIAHQWNEPLVEISAILQDLQLSFATGTLQKEEVNQYVKDSMTQIQFMSKTLKDFHNFVKPSNKQEFFKIRTALDDIFQIIGRKIEYSYIDVAIDYKFNQPILLYGYPNEFKQVLLNIIINAHDSIVSAREKGKIKKGKITIIISPYEGEVSIQIYDNGLGIDESVIDKIFSSYFTTKEQGHGFGLYMSKIIVEDKMEGKIKAYNTDEGACLQILIKRYTETDNEDITT